VETAGKNDIETIEPGFRSFTAYYIDREYFEKWRMKRRNFFPPIQQVTFMQFSG